MTKNSNEKIDFRKLLNEVREKRRREILEESKNPSFWDNSGTMPQEIIEKIEKECADYQNKIVVENVTDGAAREIKIKMNPDEKNITPEPTL